MKIKFILSFFLFFLVNVNLYSQKNFFNYERVKVEDIDTIENYFNSKIYDSKYEHINNENGKLVSYGKPKIYQRTRDKKLGITQVIYFYLKNDTSVNKVYYSWVSPKNSGIQEFSNQFDIVVKKISQDLNLPIENQGQLTKKMDSPVVGDLIEIKERNVNWKYKEAKILVRMLWTESKGAYLSTTIEWEK